MADLIDVEIANHGSFYTFLPLTSVAQEWFDANTPDAMTMGGAAVVEHRYARDIADSLVCSGMVLS